MIFKSNKSVAMPKYLEMVIPYDRCYEEMGIIEASGKYTRMYLVKDIRQECIKDYDGIIAQKKMEEMFRSFPKEICFQFVVHNRLVDEEKCLEKLYLSEGSVDKGLEEVASCYNEVVEDNFPLGHNNMKKVLYFVCGVRCDVVDDAMEVFQVLDGELPGIFDEVYGTRIKALSLVERLKVMHSIFNPGKKDFGDLIRLDDEHGSLKDGGAPGLKEDVKLSHNGAFLDSETMGLDLGNLKYMKLKTKDLVAPSGLNVSKKFIDYGILNENESNKTYFRSFYINSLPREISASFLADITNVSSSMLFSSYYESLDEQLILDALGDRTKNETIVSVNAVRDTISDRKSHRVTKNVEIRDYKESTYFNLSAMDAFKEIVAGDERAFNCVYTITLFSDDPEVLDLDTELLKISAVKFGASVRCLDLQQEKGLMSCLPLCSTFVDAYRVLSSARVSPMSPIGVYDAVKKDGLFMGLNGINDSLILLNRKNNVNLSGVILGSEHSGKSYQMKREIVNALLGSEDKVSVITMSDEYDEFGRRLGGKVVSGFNPDFMDVEAGYGLIDDDLEAKFLFLSAWFCELAVEGKDLTDEDRDKICVRVTEECDGIFERVKGGEALIDVLNEVKGSSDYPYIGECVSKVLKPFRDNGTIDERLCIYKVQSGADIIMMLDYFWNEGIRDKRKGKSNWVFIDGADEVLRSIQGADYLLKYLKNASCMQNVVTFSVDDCLGLFNSSSYVVGFEDVLKCCGYVKLLNQGPIERRKLAKILKIPGVLMPYISNVSPGKGLILTPQSNMAFSDNCGELYPGSGFGEFFGKPGSY